VYNYWQGKEFVSLLCVLSLQHGGAVGFMIFLMGIDVSTIYYCRQ